MKRIIDELFVTEENRGYSLDDIIAIRIQNGEFYFLGWMENAERYSIQWAKSNSKIERDLLIASELETAMYAKELDAQRRQLMRCVDEIDQRFCKLQNGDLTEERCRKDADKLFTKSQNPQEWELAKAFLCDKYGKEIADFVIKEMD